MRTEFPNDPDLQEVIQKLTNGTQTGNNGGHYGTNVTAHKVGTSFYWKGLHQTVKKVIRECDVCLRQKADLATYPGLLQPLPIPKKVWSEISMDFIVGLPKSQRKSVIFVVVDMLSKSLQAREAAIEMVKFHIIGAQNRMKKYADLKRSEEEFALGM
nr:retrotransposon-related protein [Tanacetum cinerariifolium]